jgi:LmbE family N-acetylglucosaminyl deacetylase
VSETVLVISPHLDDAVLSLGGTIARWHDEGARVVVATVYTSGPPLDSVPPSMRRFADYGARTREDAAALAIVGAEPRWLGQVERAFRPPYLTGLAIFTTPRSRDGFSRLADIGAALDDIDVDPDLVAIPLGVGNHVDHVETMVAASAWLERKRWSHRAVYYEDPYAVSGAMRRSHFVTRRHRWPPWRAPVLKAPRLAALLRAAAFARHGPPIESYLDTRWSAARWSVAASAIDAHEERKLEAIAAYSSQTRAFGGMASVARVIGAYHRCLGGEPLWHAAP